MTDEAKAEQVETPGDDHLEVERMARNFARDVHAALRRRERPEWLMRFVAHLAERVGAPIGIGFGTPKFQELVFAELPGPYAVKRKELLERCDHYRAGLEGIAEDLGHGAGSGYGLGGGPTSDVQVIGKVREEVRDLRREAVSLRKERNVMASVLGMLPGERLGPPGEDSALVRHAARTEAADNPPHAVERRNAVSPKLYACAYTCGWQGRKPMRSDGTFCPECLAPVRRVPT
jgi:hypothetical protein